MTDVTQDRDQAGAELSTADEQVLRELTERARAGGLKLTGEGGLLGRLTKMVIEGALEGELDDHLGYGRHDPAGRDGGNSRNGRRAKTVITETGPACDEDLCRILSVMAHGDLMLAAISGRGTPGRRRRRSLSHDPNPEGCPRPDRVIEPDRPDPVIEPHR
jgi:hypothetical protein